MTERTDDKLTIAQAAALTGVKPVTWRSYVSRGQRPAPDGYADPCGCPWWYRSTLIALYRDRMPAGLVEAAARADPGA